MTDQFFDKPILNSPYDYPARHWELDANGQPTNRIVDERRRAEFITPIPKPKKRRGSSAQEEIVFNEATDVSSRDQRYETMSIVNDLRRRVDAWRKLQNPSDWRVTPETARLLQHWRHHAFGSFRPFYCQVEATETMIWLSEVAPNFGKEGRTFLEHFEAASEQANPGLARIALKLATGAGKTTVMAMLIAWQTINAVRRPNSKKFTRGFLVATPGITIRDRLRVLQPNDPDSYYCKRRLKNVALGRGRRSVEKRSAPGRLGYISRLPVIRACRRECGVQRGLQGCLRTWGSGLRFDDWCWSRDEAGEAFAAISTFIGTR